MSSRSTELRRRLMLCAGVSTACLLFIELVFGAWLVPSRSLGFLNVPRNLELRHDARELYSGGGIVVYRRDAYGLRGSHRDPAEIDVLAIGGSTTNERLVTEGRTWTDVLGHRLAAPDRPCAVANAGVDGHSTVGHLRSFRTWFPKVPGLRPRWVVVYAGVNDLFVEAHDKYDTVESPGLGVRLYRAIQYHSALAGLLRRLRASLGARVVYGAGAITGPFEATAPASDDPVGPFLERADAFAERLRALEALIRESGARAVFVTQPRGDYRIVDGEVRGSGPEALDWYQRLNLFNARTLAVCAETESICVDLASELHFADGDFFDVMHTTPAGSEKIGAYLANALATTVCLEPRRSAVQWGGRQGGPMP